MSNMFRLNKDGTVDRCDDTPDEDISGVKYCKSQMRNGRWVCMYWNTRWNEWTKKYVDAGEVPKIIKMFDLLEP